MKASGLPFVPDVDFLAINDVMRRFGLGRSSVYKLVEAGAFPKPVHLGRSARWSTVELARFERSLRKRRDAPQKRP